jgi:hypothetical protein
MIRRALALGAAVLAGTTVGAVGGLAVQDDARDQTASAPTTVGAPITTVALPAVDAGVLLVWTRDRLPAGLAATVGALPGVSRVAAVRGGTLDLVGSRDHSGQVVDEPGPGWAIPLDAIAIAPGAYAAFLPAGAAGPVRSLQSGEALLGTTSARLRGSAAGGTVELAGSGARAVVGVVDDELVGAAELVLDERDPAAATLAAERYLLVSYVGPRDAIEAAVRGAVGARPVRFRAPGETPYLRDGDAVLPQALIKDRFGEFSYRPAVDGAVEVDSVWATENIVSADVPLIGTVRCHRSLVAAVDGAMRELVRENLGHLVDAKGFAGCWVPRRIAGSERLSRHTWGAAFDLNPGSNPTGLGSAQDPRLVEVLRRWGFTSGAEWLLPDPSHFEYVRPARG